MSPNEKVKLLYGDMEITEQMYHTVHVLNVLDDLKEMGIVMGGYDVDKTAFADILVLGAAAGYAEPNIQQVEEIMDGLMAAAEMEEDDFDGEVSDR